MKPIDFREQMSLKNLLTLPFKIDPFYSILSTLSSIITAAIAPLGVLVTSYFVDTALSVFAGECDSRKIVLPILLIAAFKIYEYVWSPILNLLTIKHDEKEWTTFDYPLLKEGASLEIKYREDPNMASHIGLATSGSAGFTTQLPGKIKSFAVLIAQLISYLAILVVRVPFVAIAAILLCVPMILLSKKKEEDVFAKNIADQEQNRYISAFKKYLTGRESVAERNLFGYSSEVADMYEQTEKKTRDRKYKYKIKWGIREQAFELCRLLLCTIGIFIMLPDVMNGDITIGTFISLTTVLFSSFPSILTSLQNEMFFLRTFKRSYNEFNDFLALDRNPGALDDMSTDAPKFEKLELKNVSFSYPNTDKLILDHVNLVIENGRKYALVGANGSGKTTITKLILRMYDNYEGEILLNGKDLRLWKMADIKAMFGAITQSFEKYSISLEDNIKVGSGFTASDDEVDKAIELAGLSDAVKDLPEGKKSKLSKIFKGGVDLSGGQWQRIAIARGIVSHAQLKILDEPTAALDPIAEKEVYDHFGEISRGAATLFISHRLASAKMADVIYVLDGGSIAESGSHSELMEQNGLYAEMFKNQQSWYL